MSEYRKPVPRGEDVNGEFYQFCKQHELRFQRCQDCGTWRHMPRESCAACGSFSWSWERSCGQGQLFSWTVIHRALHPGFTADVPYATAVIELAEGVRLVSQVLDVPVEQFRIGLPVEVVFEDVTPEVTLPKFRPVAQRAGERT
ncbi:MAG: DNA-binding protein [Candidatus Tectomicrobia bacterium]|uniref:DNA-binding protein n=1 Tax=Tectimicrobiota bacterium TaxID=2528274 RepID=A0A937W7E3_UNCTE|nr:DNA-binding protein [Candidatus Tectomicrobia bacterium]